MNGIPHDDRITRVTRVLKRGDGTEVRIVAQAYFGAGLHRSIGIDVFRRDGPTQNWTYCSDRPHPNWRSMSVDEYKRSGRSEMLQVASHGEILSVACLIGNRLQTSPGRDAPRNIEGVLSWN